MVLESLGLHTSPQVADMPSPKRQITRIAAYGLVVQKQRILLCRVSEHLPLDAGYWTLPGGGLIFGEDPVDTMVREVHEETGLIVRSRGLASVDSFLKTAEDHDFQWIRIIYHTELLGGTLTNELDGSTDLCAWWTYEETKTLPLVDLTKVGLELIFRQP